MSATTGESVERLEHAIIDRLPEGEPLYPDDYLTDQPEPFLAAEIVREKLLALTHAEIPFSSAVVIDRFEAPTDGQPVLRLYCTIVVDRESQKPIVIGKNGEMIKKIGTTAREELERLFSARVYLDLRVRAKAGWREDESVLHDIGLGGWAREPVRKGFGRRRLTSVPRVGRGLPVPGDIWSSFVLPLNATLYDGRSNPTDLHAR